MVHLADGLLRTTHLCKGSDKIKVIDFGLKSIELAGLEILGIITAVFHCRGTFCN